MTPQQIAADVDRLLEIKIEIAKLTDEAKGIEARLEQAGLEGDQVPLEDADREGKQYLARGSKKIVPVRFESDLIAGSFKPDSQMHRAVLEALGEEHVDKLPKFFLDTRAFERVPKDGQEFRKLARKLLPPAPFAALISAATQRTKDGIPKSKTVIAWDNSRLIHA